MSTFDILTMQPASPHVRISVMNIRGRPTTISISLDDYATLATLARGSSTDSVVRRVSHICRASAAELIKDGYTGTFSAAVRKRANAKLRGSYREDRARAYDQMEFPEGKVINE